MFILIYDFPFIFHDRINWKLDEVQLMDVNGFFFFCMAFFVNHHYGAHHFLHLEMFCHPGLGVLSPSSLLHVVQWVPVMVVSMWTKAEEMCRPLRRRSEYHFTPVKRCTPGLACFAPPWNQLRKIERLPRAGSLFFMTCNPAVLVPNFQNHK